MEDSSLCELGDVTFIWEHEHEFGSRHRREETIYECLECGSLVVNKNRHIQWHEQMEGTSP